MNSENAFLLINQLFLQTSTSLSPVEKEVFCGCWDEKSYPKIADEFKFSEQYLKETGPKLFVKIESLLQIKGLNKRNLKIAIETVLLSKGEIDILNPFIPLTGRIDNQQYFFNRDSEVKRIFGDLKAGSSVALIGESSIGKSSLLKIIEMQSQQKLNRKPIYLNLQTIDDEDDFYSAFCGLAGIPNAKGSELSSSLQRHQLLLILDEVEKMTWDGFTNKLRSKLRGLAEANNGPPPLRLVLAARTPLDILFPDSQTNTSPFQNIFTQETLKPWGETTSRNFIASRLTADWLKKIESIKFTEDEIETIIKTSGGYPQKLMELCYRKYDTYLDILKKSQA